MKVTWVMKRHCARHCAANDEGHESLTMRVPMGRSFDANQWVIDYHGSHPRELEITRDKMISHWLVGRSDGVWQGRLWMGGRLIHNSTSYFTATRSP